MTNWGQQAGGWNANSGGWGSNQNSWGNNGGKQNNYSWNSNSQKGGWNGNNGSGAGPSSSAWGAGATFGTRRKQTQNQFGQSQFGQQGQQQQAKPANSFSSGTSSWGSYNASQPVTQTQEITSIGMRYSNITAQLKSSTGDQVLDYSVRNLLYNEVFNEFPVDYIRYCDYMLKGQLAQNSSSYGYGGASSGGFGNLTTQKDQKGFGASGTSGFGANNQQLPTKPISPWEAPQNCLNIATEPETQQTQPYGTVPPPLSKPPITEGEPIDKSYDGQEIDRSFLRPTSLSDTIQQQQSRGVKTPGLTKLIARRFTGSDAPLIPQNMFEEHVQEKTTINHNILEYTYVPSLEEISNGQPISGFAVIHRDYGSVIFPSALIVSDFDISKAIVFSERQIDVQLPGMKEYFPSIVSLTRIYPTNGQSLKDFESELKHFCAINNCGFILYDAESGVLRMSVPKLSSFPIRFEH